MAQSEQVSCQFGWNIEILIFSNFIPHKCSIKKKRLNSQREIHKRHGKFSFQVIKECPESTFEDKEPPVACVLPSLLVQILMKDWIKFI